ncbi:hypothetical protein SAMN02745123_02660 [Desulforamulus aeronauticus DSM 10349]|uniref:Uncharacterized protein n=1 Tax=Desulforamulus aeronauticus DSM 10349 TaxID=1121421 RepID=A0A1M6U9M4_9FIRM|nr:hypothetical protein SAMN02745123_02660 [Desulforamulus aeronauticus DSM 10349]
MVLSVCMKSNKMFADLLLGCGFCYFYNMEGVTYDGDSICRVGSGEV